MSLVDYWNVLDKQVSVNGRLSYKDLIHIYADDYKKSKIKIDDEVYRYRLGLVKIGLLKRRIIERNKLILLSGYMQASLAKQFELIKDNYIN